MLLCSDIMGNQCRLTEDQMSIEQVHNLIRKGVRKMKLYRKRISKYLNNHVGEEMNTYEMITDCYGEESVSDMDGFEWMDLDARLMKCAYEAGYVLDKSLNDDAVIGLPHVIPFVITRRESDLPLELDREKYDETVLSIAQKEVNSMSRKDRVYYLSHPDYNEHHVGYGMYLRNKYIHGKMNVLQPDNMSDDIFSKIIELLKEE